MPAAVDHVNDFAGAPLFGMPTPELGVPPFPGIGGKLPQQTNAIQDPEVREALGARLPNRCRAILIA